MHFMSISSYNLHINFLPPDLNPYSARISGPSGHVFGDKSPNTGTHWDRNAGAGHES